MLSKPLKQITLYTDGACSGNPGPGGWGVLLMYQGHEKVLSGGAANTTNNRMELQAVIEGLKTLKEPCHVALYTDSKYVKDGAEKWLVNWQKKNWQTANKSPVKNQDLWQELAVLLQHHHIEWHWVKGHNGDVYNERADALARAAISAYL